MRLIFHNTLKAVLFSARNADVYPAAMDASGDHSLSFGSRF